MSSHPTQPADSSGVLNPSGFAIARGINLSHWLSQDFGWAPREEYVTRDDVGELARMGFDHIRLPIDEGELWQPDGKPNEREFDRLLAGIGWARDAGLRVVMDVHTLASHHFNAINDGGVITLWKDGVAQRHFLDLWRQLSERLGHLPVDELAYEFLNEPVADDADDWNVLLRHAYTLIRAREPQRVLVLGANRWQQPEFVPQLFVPADDPNVILGVHSYAPLLFTHYKAYWTSFPHFQGAVRYPGPVADPAELSELWRASSVQVMRETKDAGDDWGRDRFRQLFAPAIERARATGLQLYCGEFGCLPTVERSQRLAYYRDFTDVMREAGMAWAAWEWKGDFGIYEWRGQENLRTPLDAELVDILVAR